MVAGWPSGGEAVKPRDGTSRSIRAYAAARENSGARPRCEPERAPGWGTRISVPVVRLERAEALRVHRGRSQRDHLEHHVVEIVVGLREAAGTRVAARVAILEAHEPGVGLAPARDVQDQRLQVAPV